MFRGVVALVVIAVLSTAARAGDVVHGDLGAALDRAVGLATYGQFRGCVLVARDGEVILAKGYGVADQSGDPITADSLLELASVSKAFTAAAVLRLEARGKLTTADPISRHLEGVPADKKEVTIHHLLTHTSGIGDPVQEFPTDDREAAVRVLVSAPMVSEPGSAFSYSNPGYWLLAAIVERASGVSFEQFVRDEVLRPAGMSASGCQTDPQLDLARCVDRVVNGERAGSAGECPYPFVWGYRGSGGVVVSARDMASWDRALRGDALLSADARGRMFTPEREGYAYGWEISQGPLGRVASHTGGVSGFAVSFSRLLDRDACILVITNPPHNPVELSRDLFDILFPEGIERIRATVRKDAVKFGQYGSVELPAATTVEVAPSEGGGVVVRFKVRDDGAAPLELDLSKGAAMTVASRLIAEAEPVVAAADGAAMPPLNLGIYTAAYAGEGDPLVVEGAGVRAVVMGGSPHADADASLRVTLVIMDLDHSFWPVIAKFSAAQAKEVGDRIAGALAP